LPKLKPKNEKDIAIRIMNAVRNANEFADIDNGCFTHEKVLKQKKKDK